MVSFGAEVRHILKIAVPIPNGGIGTAECFGKINNMQGTFNVPCTSVFLLLFMDTTHGEIEICVCE
jgi:hypothetical protein